MKMSTFSKTMFLLSYVKNEKQPSILCINHAGRNYKLAAGLIPSHAGLYTTRGGKSSQRPSC
jgi:hypothetical protein